MTILSRALAFILLAMGMLDSFALAQSPKKVPGSWWAGGDKFGLTFDRDDAHPYFAYGNCNRQGSRPQAALNLEPDPKLFGDVVAAGKYIFVKWTDKRSQGILIAEGLALEETGPFRWLPYFTMSLETLAQWQTASSLQLTLGVGEDVTAFKSRQSYVMPDDNRNTALAAFIRSCSERQPR